ncbi:MAG TPA: ZIP family metal transporter [Candidatus Limnocylindria bacterium]|nr:ZIP family metal transporter [Candidatus Limnocylindria bacterium]
MAFTDTLVLGAIAGFTIFLGLPVAGLRTTAPRYLAFLNAIAIGILLFLFVEIMHAAAEPVEEALKEGSAALSQLGVLLVLGFGLGLLSLVYYTRRVVVDPTASAARLALLIAAGIGLHNFSEGLAIGSSSQRGDLTLALTLVVGFGLHNITEAFGIAAPLAGRPVGWRVLGLAGLIAGGPTFFGTIVGYSFTSEPLAVLFNALAGGALVFVIGELFAAGRRLSAPTWNGWGLTAGFFAALLTDFALVAAGG